MANTEKNKQYQETEDRIEEVYRALRQTLPLERVTVSQICKEAQINRSSFYYHYLDVYDLNEKLVYKMNDRLSQKMGEVGRDFLSRTNLLVFFQHIKDEMETYKLMTSVQVQFPIQRSFDQFKSFLLQKPRYEDQTEEELLMSIVYVQAGFHYMMRQWLADDCRMPVEQIVDLFLNELD